MSESRLEFCCTSITFIGIRVGFFWPFPLCFPSALSNPVPENLGIWRKWQYSYVYMFVQTSRFFFFIVIGIILRHLYRSTNILFYFCFYASCYLWQQLTTVKQTQQFLSRRVQYLLRLWSLKIFGRNTCKLCEPDRALPPRWNRGHEVLAWSHRTPSFNSSQIFYCSSVSQAYKIDHGFISSPHSLTNFSILQF